VRTVLFPAIVAAIGYLGVTHTDKVVDLYRAAYPSDPQKSLALDRCAERNPNFNRLDSADRAYCYSEGYGARPAMVTLGPVPSPSYDFNLSHLPQNDIRRQQANDSYTGAPTAPPSVSAGLTTPAMAAPVPQAVPATRLVQPAATARSGDQHPQHGRRHPPAQPQPYQPR
jgi:hypothetical protein